MIYPHGSNTGVQNSAFHVVHVASPILFPFPWCELPIHSNTIQWAITKFLRLVLSLLGVKILILNTQSSQPCKVLAHGESQTQESHGRACPGWIRHRKKGKITPALALPSCSQLDLNPTDGFGCLSPGILITCNSTRSRTLCEIISSAEEPQLLPPLHLLPADQNMNRTEFQGVEA